MTATNSGPCSQTFTEASLELKLITIAMLTFRENPAAVHLHATNLICIIMYSNMQAWEKYAAKGKHTNMETWSCLWAQIRSCFLSLAGTTLPTYC